MSSSPAGGSDSGTKVNGTESLSKNGLNAQKSKQYGDPASEQGTSVIFGNVRGLYDLTDQTKPSILLDLAKMKNSFMICLVETKLTENVSDHEITQNGWNIFRCDRKRRLGGGSAIYVREEFPVSDVLSHSTDTCDTICVYLPETNLAQITTYSPPNSSVDHFKESIDVIRKWIYDMENKYNKTPLISIN